MDKILAGVATFQTQVFPHQRELFEHLACKQQKPIALFITCSDSRVHPNLITQTEPGDLFLLRNAGNIIPPYGAASGGEGATIEYAVAALGVKNIIVCGHSQCGAMKALLIKDPSDDLPAVKAWFAHAEGTRRIVQDMGRGLSPEEQHRLAIQQNILVQIDNLRTHPSVAAALQRGELQLHGWVYSIESGEVITYDFEARRFAPLRLTSPSVNVRTRLRETLAT